jgi:hypothetical protein
MGKKSAECDAIRIKAAASLSGQMPGAQAWQDWFVEIQHALGDERQGEGGEERLADGPDAKA